MMEHDEGARRHVGIIGVGPIGGILAAHLASAGEDVVVVDILEGHLEEIRNNSLRISGIVDMDANIPNALLSISELGDYDLDYLFVAVKAPVLPRIMGEIERVVGPDTKVISYQNGLDTEILMADHLDPDNVFRAVVNYAGMCKGRGHIKMTFFNGHNYIGSVNGGSEDVAREIADMMTSASLDCEATPGIRKYVWEKVILNCALSSLCTVTGRTMKQVMDNADTRELVEQLLREAISVAEADGIRFDDGFFDHCISYLDSAGDHKPSMLIDVECRRPTEIDFMNSKVIEYGRRYGVPTPYNDFVTKLVKSQECTYMDPED